jgi:hypothetical protein
MVAPDLVINSLSMVPFLPICDEATTVKLNTSGMNHVLLVSQTPDRLNKKWHSKEATFMCVSAY